jgi:serine/threonine-protein kinase
MFEEARARSPVQPGDIVGGKYRVERLLGSGGMGVVVAATHIELQQPVALKFILPESMKGPDSVERFIREARAIARLKSEHVARVHDVGRDETNNPYMVLELLDGEDLAKLNLQKGPLTVADSVEYVIQACAGLVEAHTAGIIHRDLKPQNLFVTRRQNGLPLVKLLDFGIAKSVGAAAVGQVSLTDSKAVMGSPLYMPPEMMRTARAADVRSDVWSIGVILYELLGGRLPFDGETVTEICVRVVNDVPTPLLTLRPALDPRLAEIVMRCLEKHPDKRWQNIAQLGAALEPYSKSGTGARPWQSFADTLDSVSTGPKISTQPILAGSVPPPSKHAQTDVTWGEGSDPRTEVRTRSFGSGILVGVVLSLGAIAVAVIVLVPRLFPKPISTTVETSAPAKTEIPVAAASALPAAIDTTPIIVSATPAAPEPRTAPKRRRPPAAPATSAAPVTPTSTTEKPADAPNGAPILH